ncbi:hypothetical protein F4604DRAFT_1676738 [Suillus subluteus]|nr:hypothetical protein F4604DRAFT_1676738 [Suillus subluteus]
MAPHRTCAKNATTHPGQIVLDTQPKQCTKAEKQADDDRLAAARMQKEADALAGLTRLAEMQVWMEATQTQAAEKPKAVKLRPVPKGRQVHTSQSEEPFSLTGRWYPVGNTDDPGEMLKDQIFDEDESLGHSNNEIPGGTKQKSRKQMLKVAISNVRENIDADVNDAHANNEKGNLMKPSLGGHIQSWRTHIILKRTSISSCAPPPPSSKADDTEDLVGAFGDEDLDEALKQEVAALMSKSWGKQPAMSTISILSTSTDPDFEPPPSTQPCLKNHTLMPPPSTLPGLKNWDLMPPPLMQPRAISNTKRKKLAEVDELDADIKPKPAPLPPSKKVKLKKNAKLEGNIKSKGTLTALPGTWVESVSKACSSYLNTDLPPGCHEDGKWAQIFLPTVFLWLSTQEELWVITDAKLLMACKEIFKVVYPDICYNVTMSGSIFGVVTQRIGEWWSNFGSTALAIAIDFCASNQDSTPAELAELLLSATFRSAFVQELLVTVHLSRILGHADVTVLNTDGLIKHWFCWDVGVRAHLKTPKTFNKAKGKETVSEHTFSIAKWKSKIDAFIRGAAEKGEASTELTVSMAGKLLKKPSFQKYSSNDSFEDNDNHVDICHPLMLLMLLLFRDFMTQPAMDFVEFSCLK